MKLNSLVLFRCHIQVCLLRLLQFTRALHLRAECFSKFRGPKLGCALDSMVHQICVSTVFSATENLQCFNKHWKTTFDKYVLLFYSLYHLSFFYFKQETRSRHGSENQWRASHHGRLGSVSAPSMWGFWKLKWHKGQLFLQVLQFSPIFIILPMLHFHSFIHSSNTNPIQAGFLLCIFFLCDFTLTRLGNLYQFSHLRNNVQFKATWHTDNML